MATDNITLELLDIVSSETTEDFIKKIELLLHKPGADDFYIWFMCY